MLELTEVQGVVFDVDDTLLDNGNRPGDHINNLHSRSRLMAVHEVGRMSEMPRLVAFTPEDNVQAFVDSPVHSLEGVVWQILLLTGSVTGEVDYNNTTFSEIVDLKNKLYSDLLLEEGTPVEGAVEFVRALAQVGLAEHFAVASTARRADIDIFLGKTGLTDLFPADRIISKEKIKRAKPHPEAFDLAFASLDLPEVARPNVLAFEDDPRGIVSAKAAGLYACGIGTRYTMQDLLDLPTPPDSAADTWAEFAEQLGLPTLAA